VIQKKETPSLPQLKRFSGLDVDVLEVLREGIFDGIFLPGDRLNESRIANGSISDIMTGPKNGAGSGQFRLILEVDRLRGAGSRGLIGG